MDLNDMERGTHTIPVALTLDVDPDANMPVPGRVECVSAGFGSRVTIAAVRRGLLALQRLLISPGLPATVFWEARTLKVLVETDPDLMAEMAGNEYLEHACHGLRHEDLTACYSKRPISCEEKRFRIEKATDIITSMTGSRPAGFRAPYCRVDAATLEIIAGLGYKYDASMTFDACKDSWTGDYTQFSDMKSPPGLREMPLLLWRDGRGRPISGYLWQLIEGRRTPGEYVGMVLEIGEKHPGRLIQLAVHPWHLAAGEDGSPVEDMLPGIGSINAVLHSLKSDPRIRFTTVLGCLETRAAGEGG